MYRIAVCEDEPNLREGLCAQCREIMSGLDEITVSGTDNLTMLNEGGYSVQTTFDANAYLSKISTADNPLTEIPDGGIAVYMKAEVLEGDETLPEPIYSNNYGTVTCENLKIRTGQDVSITSDLAISGETATVTASLQNNRLSRTTTGNVIVTLLDTHGDVIAQKQSYTGTGSDNGLISLAGEKKDTETFTFQNVAGAASVQVAYTDQTLNTADANLTDLKFSNIPGVDVSSFGESGTYAVSTDDLDSTAVTFATKSPTAAVKVELDGKEVTADPNTPNARNLTLIRGKVHTVTITVTDSDQSGTQTKTYTLTIQNNGNPVINTPEGRPNPGESTQYSASTFYAADAAEISLDAAATPEEGYTLSYQWYSCDADGNNTKPLENETASTLTIPNTTDVGVYY